MKPKVVYSDFASDVRLADPMMLASAAGTATRETNDRLAFRGVSHHHEQTAMPSSNIAVDMIQVRLELPQNCCMAETIAPPVHTDRD